MPIESAVPRRLRASRRVSPARVRETPLVHPAVPDRQVPEPRAGQPEREQDRPARKKHAELHELGEERSIVQALDQIGAPKRRGEDRARREIDLKLPPVAAADLRDASLGLHVEAIDVRPTLDTRLRHAPRDREQVHPRLCGVGVGGDAPLRRRLHPRHLLLHLQQQSGRDHQHEREGARQGTPPMELSRPPVDVLRHGFLARRTSRDGRLGPPRSTAVYGSGRACRRFGRSASPAPAFANATIERPSRRLLEGRSRARRERAPARSLRPRRHRNHARDLRSVADRRPVATHPSREFDGRSTRPWTRRRRRERARIPIDDPAPRAAARRC